MARQRRIASNSDHDGNDNGDDSAAPPIPERSPKRQSLLVPEGEDGDVHGDLHSLEAKNKGKPSRRESFRGLALDVPIDEGSEDLSFGLDKEFDRVIEAQKVWFENLLSCGSLRTACERDVENGLPKMDQVVEARPQPSRTHSYQSQLSTGANYISRKQKGYLMRQNTKVVVASSRQFSDEKPPPTPTLEPSAAAANDDPRGGTRSAGNSPRKPPHERTKSWTTEPWNGKSRRRSVKGVGRKPPSGPAPPMPGQESAMGGLDTLPENGVPVDEEECMGGEAEDGERGRLFVKVVGVKDLDMPLPKNERTWFQLTLDNGLHCVTTSWLELGRSAPIGQEFELVVLNELEFQLTLQTKLEPPPQPAVESYPSASSPTKTPKQKSAFSRLLASPRKRKEAAKEEAAAREAEAAAAAAAAAEARRNARDNPDATAWELLHDLVASDGSFARAYVCLKSFEDRAFGRVLDIEVPCFNEWAIEDSEAVANSVRSKSKGAHSSTQVHGVGVVRRPPYRIGRMQLQLLYVPRPRGALEEELPRSMSSATRELREAEEVKGRLFEGCLSQQGGDCPYWRRRFFRLQGTKLTAYHETTRQPRATINLSKATKLIDDRRQLTQEHVSSRGGGRRKSAFAEEEEGYMFVEEGFRLRFANGETIDFYADDAASKDGWMKVLEDVVRSNQS
ncbi:cell division protein anillin-domain-containing protein, partial [Lineolata rhizophorae]